MPLHGVLSAMRELILDEPPPTGGVEQRRAAYARRFPTLDPRELDDLAAVPPERLAVYTDVIFAGERSMLEWACPTTLAGAARAARRLGDARPARSLTFDMVRSLHRARPWRSTSVRELVANLEGYLREGRADLCGAWPALLDVAACERADTEVFYAEDDASAEPTPPESLVHLTVGALMQSSLRRPTFSVVFRFGFDVLELVRLRRQTGDVPEVVEPRRIAAACGRSPTTLLPQWVALGPGAEAALACIAPGGRARVNDLAHAYLDADADSPAEGDEQRFARFFGELLSWLRAGVLDLA